MEAMDAREIVAALERLGVEGPAAALDVLEAAPIELSESDRTAVLDRLSEVRKLRQDAYKRAVELSEQNNAQGGQE